MYIGEIMSTDVECLDPAGSILEAAEIMQAANIGALPVVDGGLLVGMLTDRDIVCRVVAEGRDPRQTLVSDIMSRNIATCREDDDIEVAIRLMETRKVRRLAVLDHENRHMVGMLSLGDLSTALPHDIAGEVMDMVSVHH